MIERRIMLVSGECPWNCYFCGYGAQKARDHSHEEMKEQIDNYFKGFEKGKIDKLKVDIPGSVLDPSQVSRETQEYLVEKCKEYDIEELVLETRPEFVNKNNLSIFEDINLTVAIGLDVADDHYLRKLKKGFSLSDYETAATIAKASGHKVKTYVLANPPFVENVKEMLDKTVREALDYSDSVVIINCYPHEKTPLMGEVDMGEDEDEEEISEEVKELQEWEPLEKEEFFDLAKNWLVNPDVEYDLRQGKVPPTWKAWVPRFSEEEMLDGKPEDIFLNSVCSTWQNFLNNRYSPPESKDTVLFIPDTGSPSRKKDEFYRDLIQFLEELNVHKDIHLVVVTPVGIMPMEFDEYYPFDSYKWDFDELDKDQMDKYKEVTKNRIKEYMENHRIDYEKSMEILNPGTIDFEAVEGGFEDLRMEIKHCSKDKDGDSIELTEEIKQNLEECIENA